MSPASESSILLVLQDTAQASSLQDHLLVQGYSVEWVTREEQAVNGIGTHRFDVLLTELQSAQIDGLRLLDVALDRDSTMPVIFLAQDNQTELSLQGLDSGASAFHTPPYTGAVIQRSIEQGLYRQSLQYEILQLMRQLDTRDGLTSLVGQSRAMDSLHDHVRQCASGAAPVILLGEPGTGKDHLARTIHNQSSRSMRAFVKAVSSDIDADSHDRMLFGLGANVFPDSTEGQAGQVEIADGGTLYLDDVRGLSTKQVEQLLHTLDTGTTQRLGTTRNIGVNVRLIVSVTPPLRDDDSTNQLLHNLQHRFGAVTIEIPALRDRSEDIALLLEHFVGIHGERAGKTVEGVDSDAIEMLLRYPWPGNVRELESAVQRMVIGARPGARLNHQDVPSEIREHAGVTLDHVQIRSSSSMQEVERLMIEDTLRACNYDKKACAEVLGIGLRTLYRKLNEYKGTG
jgi:two-component system response regulator HydG